MEGGCLSADPDGKPTVVRWIHDPADLVPSSVADPFSFLREVPDERAAEERPDAITFTSDALDGPLDLIGPISVQVGVTSTAPSTALFPKLIDVGLDGSTLMLARGQTMVRDPDPTRPARIDLAHMGYRVSPSEQTVQVGGGSETYVSVTIGPADLSTERGLRPG